MSMNGRERGRTGARGLRHRAAWGAAVGACVAAAAVLCGCGGDDRDPRRELSVDEQGALLRDIRKDSSRVQNLTPAERAYLIKKMGK